VRIPFVGPSYDLESRTAGVQRTINMVPVPLEPGNERAGWGFEDVPGLAELELTVPHGCYVTENFDDPTLADYADISGDAGLFTVVAGALVCAAQNDPTQAEIRRSFSQVTMTRFTGQFTVNSDATDDAAALGLLDSGTPQLSVLPRRETALDASRRCHILLLSDTVMTPAALTLGVRYEVEVTLLAGAGNSTWTITNVSTAAVVASGTFPGDVSSIDVDALRFLIDKDGPTCPTTWDQICIGF
jgi:hypothetical protein